MKRTLTLTFVLALAAVATAALAAAPPSPSPSPVPAGQPFLVPAPAPMTPAALPKTLNGALFASDWECEQACFDDYMQCASGCSACDQCSCQLAYCRAGCGVPFQGC